MKKARCFHGEVFLNDWAFVGKAEFVTITLFGIFFTCMKIKHQRINYLEIFMLCKYGKLTGQLVFINSLFFYVSDADTVRCDRGSPIFGI